MLNKNNWREAFHILEFNSKLDEFGMVLGVQGFEYLSFQGLEDLLNKELINPNERQNNSPSIIEIYKFIKDNHLELSLYLEGYIIDADREDTRISIDTIRSYQWAIFTDNQLEKIKEFVKSACGKRLSIDNVFAWWD